MLSSKNIYFLSDFHLGAPNAEASRQREKKIVQFLEEIKGQTAALFIVGDLFDFWYEYKKVVPRGYVRLLGKLADVVARGLERYWLRWHPAHQTANSQRPGVRSTP